MRRVALVLFSLAALASAFLAVACTWVEFLPVRAVSPHPARDTLRHARVGVERIDSYEAVARLERLDPGSDAALVELARTVAAGVTNHATPAGEIDPALAPRFLESPPVWLDFHRRLSESPDDPETIAIGRLERRNWRSALTVGLGLCSQCSLIVADFLREHGIVAQPFGLHGHVVARVFTERGERIVDGDLGVVLPFGLEQAERDPEAVRGAYLAAGYDAAYVERIVGIYGPEGNGIYHGSTIESRDAGARARWARYSWIAFACSAVALFVVGARPSARHAHGARRESARHHDSA